MSPHSPAPAAAVRRGANRRLAGWFGLLVIILAIFVGRLFYLQIIRHDYYHQQALAGQRKQYSLPASRGMISATSGDQIVPLALNQTLYTLFADPQFINDAPGEATKLAAITGGNAGDYAKLMKTANSRYVVLAKKLSADQHQRIGALKLKGVGTREVSYRTYPQGSLAAQLLGFVNDDGQGKYGLEQALDSQLAGKAGELKAITDAQGVPLVASRDNIQTDPQPGQNVTLTIDLAMQKRLEDILKAGLDKARSASGSALIMEANTGAVKAMANWPTFDPSNFSQVSDPSVFNNAAVSAPLEVGSVMKTLTTAAALDQGVIKADTSYNDPAHWDLDGHTITNIEEDGGPGNHSIADILNLSINTGATWMLMQMGGQTGVVNQTARDHWRDYMVNHYGLGKATGIEQGYEAGGVVPDPDKGYALQLTYANTAFGQALTMTPLQLGAAVAAVVNGGTYYQPHLVAATDDGSGQARAVKPTVGRSNVVKPSVSKDLQSLLEYVVAKHFLSPPFSDAYSVGGKTGTAQIANPAGGYYSDRYNGLYVGFVGGDQPQYVIVVRVNEPHIGGYAGSGAAQPIFTSLGHLLIDNFNVPTRSGH